MLARIENSSCGTPLAHWEALGSVAEPRPRKDITMRLPLALLTVAALGLPCGSRPAHAQTSVPAAALDTERPSGWVFTPTLRFGGSWDDNVLLVNPGDNPPGDYASPIDPSANLEYTGRRTRFLAGYQGSLVLYRSLDNLNSFSQMLRVAAEHRVTRRLKVFGEEHFARATTTDALQLAGVPYYRIGSRTNSTGGGAEAALAKHTLLRGAYMLRWVDFDVDARSAGELRGGYAHEADLSLVHALSPLLAVGGEYNFTRATVGEERGVAANPIDRFNIQTARATAQYRLAPSVSLSGAIGVSRLGAGLEHGGRTGATWRVEISRRGPRSVLSASYHRSFVPSFGFGGTSENEEWRGTVHLPFERAYVTGSVGWSANEPLESGPSLESLLLSGTTGYRVTRWLSVEGFYGRTQQDTQRAGGDLRRNEIGFRIVATRPMKLR
jgi:hypothetical protein